MVMQKELGFIGLGRMGLNMVNRIVDSKKIDIVVWNRSKEPLKEAVKRGAKGANSIEDLIDSLKQERKIVWLMLPAGEVTNSYFKQVNRLLNRNDIIIDGSNSHFKDTLQKHKLAAQKGIDLLDVGVSGGIVAATRGYPLMIGGKKEIYNYCKPIFESFGIKEGFGLVGGPGTGHYVKMIHNAIEYGMMQAISEGFDLLNNGRFKELDLKQISHIWNHGTIISSFLMEMACNILKRSPDLDYLKPFVDDSGEGRWAAIEALEQKIPFVVNSYAINARYISRDENSFAFRMLGAIRNEFGGHSIKK